MAMMSRDPAAAETETARGESARGVVGTVAAMHRDAGAAARHAGIVDRVFGPGASERAAAGDTLHTGTQPLYPEIDVEFSLGEVARRLASVLGPASKIAGDLVADENVEIQGLVEGRVRARRSRVTIGVEGLVRSRIEARSVRIRGTVRGNVTAEDWVEVKPGGVIFGDVRAPRVILHDGATVTGRLQMPSAALRRSAGHFDPLVIPPRPRMRKVGGAKKPGPRTRPTTG
ncbi:MAG: polymer-forming cytoskeletal protein [Myxococcota bacterium]